MNFIFLLCFSLGMVALALELLFLLAFESHHPADPGRVEGGSLRREVAEAPQAEGPQADGPTHPFWAKPSRPLSPSAFWLAFGAGGIVGNQIYSSAGSLLVALLLGALGAWSFGKVGRSIRHLLEARTRARAQTLLRAGAFAREPLSPLGFGVVEAQGLPGPALFPARSLESVELAARARLTIQHILGRLAYVCRGPGQPTGSR